LRLLESYHGIVQAQRMVASAQVENNASFGSNSSAASFILKKTKRSLRDARGEDEDETMGNDDMDMDRFTNRADHQPFMNDYAAANAPVVFDPRAAR